MSPAGLSCWALAQMKAANPCRRGGPGSLQCAEFEAGGRALGMKRVLLIDDDDNIRKLVTFSLKAMNLEFIEATDGKEGFRTALKELPDLILLDLSMPNMNGFEACEKIKGNEKTAHIPIIVVSAEATDLNRQIVTGALKADRFLAKPFERAALVEVVEDVLGPSS